VLAGIGGALVHRLAQVHAVAEDPVDIARRQGAAALCGGALGAQHLDQPGAGFHFNEALQDPPHQRGFVLVHHQLPLTHVVAERHVATHPHAPFARRRHLVADAFANHLALELREREQDVKRERPMLVVVLKECVTETKVTWLASNTSTSLVKSSSERLRRSIL
jgi:hypothetical protein